MTSHADIFDQVYRSGIWGRGSGAGSTEEISRPYRGWIQSFLRSNRIQSVVDMGCGDWQLGRHIDWNGIDYLGVDVSEVVLQTARSFSRPGIRFQQGDGLTAELPAADLLIMKDVMQHWSNADIQAFLPQLNRFRCALITNGFPSAQMDQVNRDIATGAGHRPVNLSLAPFNLKGWFVIGFMMDEAKWTFLWAR